MEWVTKLRNDLLREMSDNGGTAWAGAPESIKYIVCQKWIEEDPTLHFVTLGEIKKPSGEKVPRICIARKSSDTLIKV